MTTTKPSHRLTFHDRLSRLTFLQACKLLGPQGRRLIQQGSKRDIHLKKDVVLGGDLLRVKFPLARVAAERLPRSPKPSTPRTGCC